MKPITLTRSFLFSVFCTFLVSISIYSQELTTAIDYLEYMNNQHRKIGEDMWTYTSAVAHGKNARKIEVKRSELIKTTLTARNNISKMPDFEGDASLRDTMVSYLQMSYHVLNDDYSKIVDMEEIAEQSYDMMEAYMTAQQRANEKMEMAGKILDEQISTFAKDHKINLVENKDKLGKKLQISSEVFKYYNKAYLVFFKSFKQEVYLLESLEKNDINGLEQNKNALLKTAEEGVKLNEAIPLYKNDPSMRIACKQLLDFYKQEASVKIPIIIDFYLKKENFDKTKAAFDAKMEMARTKEDVDNYNKTVNDFNKASVQYNQVNQELYKRRTVLINTWNNSGQSFFDRHVPKN
jgi:uncharacterized protein YukE